MNISQAIAEERVLPPGSYRIQFNLTDPADVGSIRQTLSDSGVRAKVSQTKIGDLWRLSVRYTKPAPEAGISFLPQAIIPLIGFGLAATIVTIGIFKIKDVTESLMKLTLAVGAVSIFLVALTRKRA